MAIFARKIPQREENKGVELTGGCGNVWEPGHGGGRLTVHSLKLKVKAPALSTDRRNDGRPRSARGGARVGNPAVFLSSMIIHSKFKASPYPESRRRAPIVVERRPNR